MAPRTRSQGLSTLPLLPTELKREILRFCDTPTLANACLASLAFLELASAFLYQDITIRGFKQLSRLFYDNNQPSTAPHLDSLLSLSQTWTFAFNYELADMRSKSGFSTGRLPQSTPLPLDTLTVRWDDVGDDNPLEFTTTAFLNLFDPLQVHCSFVSPEDSHTPWLPIEDLVWTRIQHLSLCNVIPTTFLSSSLLFSLLPPKSLKVTLHPFLDDDDSGKEGFAMVMVELIGGDWDGGVGLFDEQTALVTCDQVKEVVLETRNEAQRTDCLELLGKFWEANSISFVDREGREGMVRVEVTELKLR